MAEIQLVINNLKKLVEESPDPFILPKFLTDFDKFKTDSSELMACFGVRGFLQQFEAYVMRGASLYESNAFKDKILKTLDIQLKRLQESKKIIFELIDDNKLIKNGDRILIFSFSNTVMYIL